MESTNSHADDRKQTLLILDELMTFFGILFYMSLVDRGEFQNYWGPQIENFIFGDNREQTSFELDRIMSVARFKFIRKHLSFRATVSPNDLLQQEFVL